MTCKQAESSLKTFVRSQHPGGLPLLASLALEFAYPQKIVEGFLHHAVEELEGEAVQVRNINMNAEKLLLNITLAIYYHLHQIIIKLNNFVQQ